MKPVKQAFVSFASATRDAKEIDFVAPFHQLGIKVIATTGTAAFLQKGGVDGVVSVTNYGDTPEDLDGEHRNLSPDVWTGIGHRPDRRSASTVEPIGVVAVTLSPFIGKKNQPMEQRMSSLDAGGVAWLLDACWNPRRVAVVVSPKRYNTVLAMLRDNQGKLDEHVCTQLAQEAIIYLANYIRRVRARVTNGY